MAAIAKARRRAGFSQAELARRMKTTQSTVARLESGRGQPSTRTLLRFAKATGHRLKISFQPMKGRGEGSGALRSVLRGRSADYAPLIR
jgi:transcriptional regulator with XRE-family HTH domain